MDNLKIDFENTKMIMPEYYDYILNLICNDLAEKVNKMIKNEKSNKYNYGVSPLKQFYSIYERKNNGTRI